jgi:hypothetical protein
MRMLMNISLPVETFNARLRDGSANQLMGRIIEDLKPEAIYFTEQDGQRGAVAVVEVADPSRIPALAEPWFLNFNATVSFRIAMTLDDLKRGGLDGLRQKWG